MYTIVQNYADINNISGYNKTDFGLSIGTGIDYKIKEKYSIQLAARYQHGIADLNNNPLISSKIFNRSLYLTAGFFYKFIKKTSEN